MGSKDAENTLIYASNAVAQGISGIESAITDQTAPAVKNLSGGLTSVSSIENQITADLEKASKLLAAGGLCMCRLVERSDSRPDDSCGSRTGVAADCNL